MPCKLRFLVFLAGAIVSVVVSTNIIVVRQLNPDTNSPPFADSFSNRQCSSSSCPRRSTCAGGGCCMCQCLYDWPNVFVNRTSLKCMSYGEMNRMSSANCQYSFRGPNEPLEVIPLTTVATGKIQFRSNSYKCPIYDWSVDKWQSLDVDGRWQDGVGNVFGLEYAILAGPDGNKILTFVKWNAMLQPKYSGLIIKLLLGCAGTKVGCLLAKINGTYSSGSTPVTSPRPLPGHSAVTTPRTTQETGATSVTPLRSTPGPITTMVHTPEPSLAPSAVVPETESQSTVKAPPESAEKKQLVRNGSTSKSKVIWPAVGAIIGLICLISLMCLITAVYRRKRRSSKQPATAIEAEFADMDAKPANDKDPIYAEVQDKISDNLLYSQYTPTKDQIMRRSKQDPLPALPADEPTCQLLIERPN